MPPNNQAPIRTRSGRHVAKTTSASEIQPLPAVMFSTQSGV